MRLLLGKGTSGEVVEGSVEGVECAIKKMDRADDVRGEVQALRFLCGNPHVVQLLDVKFEGTRAHLYMEKLHKTLYAFCGKPDETLRITRALAVAVESVHACGITHGDLKPANVMVDFEGRIKLIDFGLCTFAERSTFACIATPQYRAPEVFMGGEYDRTLDVWSVGCIVYELITDRMLFDVREEENVLDAIFDLLGTPDCNYWPEALALPAWEAVARQDRWRFGDFDGIKDPILRNTILTCVAYRPYRPTSRKLVAALVP